MNSPVIDQAEDGFESYYFHKLKSWVPALYWNNDLGDDSLHHLMRAIAERAAQTRREIDQVWTASSIEMADEWAVPFIGDLVGAEPLSAQNARANRVTAANMTGYHARKTTRYLLDQFITDIVGSEGYVREIERWLARPPHSRDQAFTRRAPLSGGIVGGFPELGMPRADDAALVAFDEFARLPEYSPRTGRRASFDYGTVHFNLFPYESYRLDMVTPFWLDDTHLTLDPSGRAIPLYHAATFDHRNGELPIGPEEFPLPMRCARFNDAQFMVTQDAVDAIGDATVAGILSRWIGAEFKTRQDLRRVMTDQLNAVQFTQLFGAILRETAVTSSAKHRQIRDDVQLDIGPFADVPALDASEVVAGNLAAWIAAGNWPSAAALVFDPERGAVQFEAALDAVADPPQVFHPRFYHLGTLHRIGAGGYARQSPVPRGPAVSDANTEVAQVIPANGEVAFGDNRRYVWQWNGARTHVVTGTLRLEAADQTRPYLVSRSDAGTLDFTITGDDSTDGDGAFLHENHLVIDGLWLGVLADAAIETAVADADEAAPVTQARLILDGQFDSVTLRHVSIDPGGERLVPTTGRAIPAVTLEIEGSIKGLRIENAITGPIVETRSDPSLLNAGMIRIKNSVIVANDPTSPALSAELGQIHMENCTVFGEVRANLIYATNTIFDGPLYVANTQKSCLRYCALGAQYPAVPASVLPRQFECTRYDAVIPAPSFLSKTFGDPNFAALSPLADDALFLRGEDGTEIGVGNMRYWNRRVDDLSRFVSKFMPVGQNAQFYQDIGDRS